MSSHLQPGDHISSAVVRFTEKARKKVLHRIEDMRGVDVVYANHTTAIVVIETASSNAAGETLAGIAGVEGVLTAVLAYDHTIPQEVEGEGA